MSKEAKPRYRLERRGKTSYVGLWEGRHCLCAICTNTTRGVLDAQLILLVMNNHKDLLAAVQAWMKVESESKTSNLCPDYALRAIYRKEAVELSEAAIEATKPKPKPEQESTL